MGSVSIYHILILLVMICVVGGPMAYFGIARENSGCRVNRRTYTLTFLGLVLAMVALQAVVDLIWQPIAPAMSFIYLMVAFYLLRLTVRRLRDMGRGRGLAYLCLIPYIGLLVHIWACFPRSAGASDAEIVKAF
jgi:uncharacterized membrane protein YhaH (DUF805 family)